MARADLELLPLTPDPQNEQWYRRKSHTKFFEYMAMRMATVASSFGEITHVVTDGDDGFLADSKDEFVAKMSRLANDAALRRRMGDRARQRVEQRYCLDVLGDQVAEAVRFAASKLTAT